MQQHRETEKKLFHPQWVGDIDIHQNEFDPECVDHDDWVAWLVHAFDQRTKEIKAMDLSAFVAVAWAIGLLRSPSSWLAAAWDLVPGVMLAAAGGYIVKVRPDLQLKQQAKLKQLMNVYQWCTHSGAEATHSMAVIRLTNSLAPYTETDFLVRWDYNPLDKESEEFRKTLEKIPHRRFISYPSGDLVARSTYSSAKSAVKNVFASDQSKDGSGVIQKMAGKVLLDMRKENEARKEQQHGSLSGSLKYLFFTGYGKVTQMIYGSSEKSLEVTAPKSKIQ